MPAAVPCRGCGMMIEFHEGPNGKPIPLQRVRKVYALADGTILPGLVVGEHPEGGGVVVQEPEALYVSHFETCPKARDFSGKGRR